MTRHRQSKVKNNLPNIKSYWSQHWLDHGLDALLLLGVGISIGILIVEFFMDVSSVTLSLFLKIDVIVVMIFIADLTRNFFKTGNFWRFMKHQWLDLVIISITIIAFSSAAFIGAGRLSWLLREEKVVLLLEEERALAWIGRFWRASLFRKIFRF